MQISRPQIIELRNALINALTLSQMNDVVTQLGQDPQNIVLPSNKEEMYREIVDWYNRQNRVHQLIVVSRTYVEKNEMLNRFAQDVGLEGAFLPPAEGHGLEAITRTYLPMVNADDFLSSAAAARKRVCLVMDGDAALGTGFLVGPGAVMTNHHVVTRFIKQPADAARLRFKFDFRQDGSGGKVYQAEPADTFTRWLIHDSLRVVADTESLDAPADAPADRLDYAVVRLDGRAGEEAAGDAPRGWFTLPNEKYEFADKKALLLYHHAKGKPLQLSIDTDSYVAANTRGTRVWHRSNTEGGSSGSPCFDLEWNPVALHQGYNRLRGETVNRAAPLDAVRRLLEERGKLAELEA